MNKNIYIDMETFEAWRAFRKNSTDLIKELTEDYINIIERFDHGGLIKITFENCLEYTELKLKNHYRDYLDLKNNKENPLLEKE